MNAAVALADWSIDPKRVWASPRKNSAVSLTLGSATAFSRYVMLAYP
jgi:hypothetical protein